MNRPEERAESFVGYEYKQITVKPEYVSMYLDCYQNFGWTVDDNLAVTDGRPFTAVRMKRDRKIINRMELTRLQRNFEACIKEIQELEKAKSSAATAWALAAGVIGTVFMAGSVFAVTHEPPIVWLCVLLAIPGFAGWLLPCFIHRYLVGKQTQRLQPLIEEKLEEVYEVCEKGHSLL